MTRSHNAAKPHTDHPSHPSQGLEAAMLGSEAVPPGRQGKNRAPAGLRATAGLMEEEAARHQCWTRGLQLSGYHSLGLNGIQPTEDRLLQHSQMHANLSCLPLLPLPPPWGGCRESSGLQSTRLKSCQRHEKSLRQNT